jgi:flagellar export protein FliJ
MRHFTFRLDRILRLREEAEQRQARRMGEAAREEAELDRLCGDHARHLERVSQRLAQQPGHVINAGLLRARALTATAAAQQLEDAERERAQAREVADAERERLTKARVDRRSLERIREQRLGAWRKEADRDEQKANDEIANRGHRGGPAQ